MRTWVVVLLLAGCLSAPPPAAPPVELERPTEFAVPAPTLAAAAAAGGGFSSTDVFPGTYDTSGLLSRVLEPGPYAIREPQVMSLESKADGEAIEIGLALPNAPIGTRVPVIVVASPYFVPMTPARMRGEEKVDGALPHIWIHYEFYAKNFVPHGYAVALVSVRGSAGSGGCMDLFGPLEQADLDQAVTWLATQPWSSGAVAMTGLSYSASTPWEVAAMGNSHLRTIVPMAGLADLQHYLTYNGSLHGSAHGGFPLTYWPYAWADNDPTAGGDATGLAAGVACRELAPGLLGPSASVLTLEEDPLGFFAARHHGRRAMERWNGSIFLVHGLEDWRVAARNDYPWMAEWEARGVVVKHLLGQWGHALPDSKVAGEHRRWDYAEVLLRWFDFWLKGDASVDLGPRVQVEDSGGRWRSEDSWPPADAIANVLHLTADGLSPQPGGASEPVAVGADARRISTPLDPILSNRGVAPPSVGVLCPGCAVFSTPPLAAALRITGLPVAHLTVTPSGPSGHLTVHLLAGERVIGRGMLDLRLANGEPATVTPGTPLVARVLLEPMEGVVAPGEELTLVVHQGGYEERMGPSPSYPLRLAVGGGASFVQFLTVERGEDDFFEPPQ